MEPQDFRTLRTNLGWTQQQLADKLGMTRRAIQQYEAGERPDGTPVKIPKHVELALASLVLGVAEFNGHFIRPNSIYIVQRDDEWHAELLGETQFRAKEAGLVIGAARAMVRNSDFCNAIILVASGGTLLPLGESDDLSMPARPRKLK